MPVRLALPPARLYAQTTPNTVRRLPARTAAATTAGAFRAAYVCAPSVTLGTTARRGAAYPAPALEALSATLCLGPASPQPAPPHLNPHRHRHKPQHQPLPLQAPCSPQKPLRQRELELQPQRLLPLHRYLPTSPQRVSQRPPPRCARQSPLPPSLQHRLPPQLQLPHQPTGLRQPPLWPPPRGPLRRPLPSQTSTQLCLS
mmetsp:Transcript_7378/g.20831  ORF Transcript_7378/g.20831 Transcript_7378/m.20831 type:complete len:201 (-) Transcript_7378:1569-2171(-)